MIIRLTGWQEGMQKVSLTKLQVKYLHIDLKRAKLNVDELLEGEEVSIKVVSRDNARAFIDEAIRIGVICNLEN